MSGDPPVLELDAVEKSFHPSENIVETAKYELLGRRRPQIHAVDGVNMKLTTNQVQGVIGESGCGKTTLLRTVMGIHTPTNGEIRFHGQPTSTFTKSDWKEFRRQVQIIFQDPFNSLDPKFSVKRTIAEPLQIHDIDYEIDNIIEMLEAVDLKPGIEYLDRFPDQLSGGEKQRVSIARALISEPDVILADEPVSMLDVSTQADILNLLNKLVSEFGVSMLYISHDLSTVSYVCDRINVMYLGRIVEEAATRELISNPKHPYTQALVSAIPIPDPHYHRERTQLEGEPGDPLDIPEGCRFRDRCPERMEICEITPIDVRVGEQTDHTTACHLYYDHEETTGIQDVTGT